MRCLLIGHRKTKPHHCLSLLSIVSPLGNRKDWLLGLRELLHALYFNGSTLSLTILTVSKIYLMMRIKGDVSFQRHRISQLNITYLIIVFLVHLLGMFSHIQYM